MTKKSSSGNTWSRSQGILFDIPADDEDFLDFLINQHEGIIRGWEKELCISTNRRNPFDFQILPGAAIIDKKIYKNVAPIDISVGNNLPKVNFRYDCVVLNCSHTSRDVRAKVILGIESIRPSYPSVIQSRGDQFQMPLYYLLTVKDAGAFVAEDVRKFITITSETGDMK